VNFRYSRHSGLLLGENALLSFQQYRISLSGHAHLRLDDDDLRPVRDINGTENQAVCQLKIAESAPIPNARDRTATAVNPGLLRKVRRAYPKS